MSVMYGWQYCIEVKHDASEIVKLKFCGQKDAW